MENNNENPKKNKEDMADLLSKAAEGKEKQVAKDLVDLKHVEVQKQKIGQDTMDLARALKTQIVQHDGFEELSNDEITILETFMGKRLFLNRIAIIANQSRVPLGIEPFKKVELEKLLGKLIEKGYITSEKVGDKEVYFLTERGKYRVQ